MGEPDVCGDCRDYDDALEGVCRHRHVYRDRTSPGCLAFQPKPKKTCGTCKFFGWNVGETGACLKVKTFVTTAFKHGPGSDCWEAKEGAELKVDWIVCEETKEDGKMAQFQVTLVDVGDEDTDPVLVTAQPVLVLAGSGEEAGRVVERSHGQKVPVKRLEVTVAPFPR